ncbi:uncharacterized protein [Panulirus ornatus]|uniref:uncharacterized protein isoform X2 n=1 Tax=Panulirus ornatus TaxID=150431 RepID=UPI003A839759
MCVCQRPLPGMTATLTVVLLAMMAVGERTQHFQTTTQDQDSRPTSPGRTDVPITAGSHTDLPSSVNTRMGDFTYNECYEDHTQPRANKKSVVIRDSLSNESISREQYSEADGFFMENKSFPTIAGAAGSTSDHCDGDQNASGEVGSGEEWRECLQLASSELVQVGFRRAVALGLKQCAQLWCSHVQVSEEREHLDGVYHVVQLGHVAEHQHVCLLNLTRMVVLHHSWPMCSSDFICATNHSTFDMSALDCMPLRCRVAETLVLVFMMLASTCITIMSFVIMAVIVVCPQFHKPKYYLRFSLAATDFLIGIVVCGHAAYNQWVGLTEIPSERFPYYANLKANQLFRHVPNCLWGVSDVFTQISGFFVTSNMIISLYTLSLMSLDRYLLLTRTHYRALVTSSRVTAALVVSWCCSLLVPSLHFIYRPQMQYDICVNYDTSPLDVHIINNESKIATADYKVYLKHIVPFVVTLVVIGLPIVTLFVFSFRALRKYHSYTRERSVRQVKSALQLTQNHCSLSRQVSSTSLASIVNLGAVPKLHHLHPLVARKGTPVGSTPPPYKLKFTFKKKTENDDGICDPKMSGSSTRLQKAGVDNATADSHTTSLTGIDVLRTSSGSAAAEAPAEGEAAKSCGVSVLGALGLQRVLASHSNTHHATATIRRLRGNARASGERVTVRERDREITCTVLVNVAVFVFACFPLLGVGCWMMFLYFTQQEAINNPPPLKQLLFVAPWLMALNSLWNAVLHLSYNHKFRAATRHMIWATCRKLWHICTRQNRYQE